jgi:hypothetical protein
VERMKDCGLVLTSKSSLAFAEMYVTIAELFSNCELELFDTSFDDIKQVHDFFSPFPETVKGLRVTVV